MGILVQPIHDLIPFLHSSPHYFIWAFIVLGVYIFLLTVNCHVMITTRLDLDGVRLSLLLLCFYTTCPFIGYYGSFLSLYPSLVIMTHLPTYCYTYSMICYLLLFVCILYVVWLYCSQYICSL